MKKNTFLTFSLIVLLFWGADLSAQSPVKFGVFTGAGYSNLGFRAKDESKNEFLKGNIAFSTGVSVEWMPNNWGIRTGLTFFDKSLRVKEIEYDWVINGPPDPALPISFRSQLRHYYLEIPAEIRLKVGSKMTVSLGPSAQYRLLSKQKVLFTYQDTKEKEISWEADQAFAMGLLAGFEYRLCSATSGYLSLEPRFRVTLMSTDRPYAGNGRFWAAGLRANWIFGQL